MALTLDRWLAALVAGCLVAIALVMGDGLTPAQRPVRRDPREQIENREGRASGTARAARDRLRMMVLRDSMRTALASMPRSQRIRVVVGSRVEGASRTTRALAARLATILPAPAKNAVVVVVPADSAGRRFGANWNVQSFPTSSAESCVSISGLSMNARRLTTADGARELVGPCGYYAMFGMPGPGIDRWLRAGAWIFGSKWTTSPVGGWREDYYDWGFRQVPFRSAVGFNVRSAMNIQGFSCVTGNSDVCRTLLLNPLDFDQAGYCCYRVGRWALRVNADGMWSRSDDDWYNALLGPRMRSLFSDMAVSLGNERFQQFWSSDLPPAEAFRAASGQDLGDWTAGWGRRTYGEWERGPGVDPMSASLSVALSLLALAAAIVASRRRQVAS